MLKDNLSLVLGDVIVEILVLYSIVIGNYIISLLYEDK